VSEHKIRQKNFENRINLGVERTTTGRDTVLAASNLLDAALILAYLAWIGVFGKEMVGVSAFTVCIVLGLMLAAATHRIAGIAIDHVVYDDLRSNDGIGAFMAVENTYLGAIVIYIAALFVLMAIFMGASVYGYAPLGQVFFGYGIGMARYATDILITLVVMIRNRAWIIGDSRGTKVGK